jgi:hypothetical protein
MTVAIYARSMTALQEEHTEPRLILGEPPALGAWLDFRLEYPFRVSSASVMGPG